MTDDKPTTAAERAEWAISGWRHRDELLRLTADIERLTAAVHDLRSGRPLVMSFEEVYREAEAQRDEAVAALRIVTRHGHERSCPKQCTTKWQCKKTRTFLATLSTVREEEPMLVEIDEDGNVVPVVCDDHEWTPLPEIAESDELCVRCGAERAQPCERVSVCCNAIAGLYEDETWCCGHCGKPATLRCATHGGPWPCKEAG